MKLLILAVFLSLPLTVKSQFVIHKIETDNSTETYADCFPIQKSNLWNECRFILARYGNAMSLQMLFKPKYFYSKPDQEKEITEITSQNYSFTFYSTSGNEELTYKTTPTYVVPNNSSSDPAYYILFEKEKLYEFFKKYSKVKVQFNNEYYIFSLKGFTDAYEKLSK